MGVCAVGVPASIQNLLNVVATTLLNILASPYGAAALAAMGICSRINHVPMFIAMGLSQGIMPLLSYTYACRNIKRMKATLWFAARFSTIFLVTMSALIFVFSGPLVHLFIDDPQTVEFGEIMLRGFCLGLPFLNLDFLAVHVFQAVGMGKESLIFAILRKVVFEIPAMLLLNTLFPLFGLAYAQLTSEFMLSMIALFVLANFFKKLGREMAERAAKISE
ncbi:MAG: MATE family efflux transporter, partial [Clostridia bacterium]|nr:MATE family efflux transporter [Clostridia bacterium]